MLIDDRAGSKSLASLPDLQDIAVLTRLEGADVAISGRGPHGPVLVGVEVKSVSEFLSAAATGRLQATQIPAMLATYDVSWLALYGGWRAGDQGALELWSPKRGVWQGYRLGASKRPVPLRYIEGLLFDLAALGIHVKAVSHVTALGPWLHALWAWWGKEWAKHKGLKVFDQSRRIAQMPQIDPKVYQRALVAQTLPGLGYERAMRAARHFPSVRAMVCATAEEWAAVEGIGKVVGRAVEDAVR